MMRLSMRKIREVLRLRAEGFSGRQVAQSLSLGRATVSDYFRRADVEGLGWPLADDLDDSELERLLFPRSVGNLRASPPQPNWADVHGELRRKGVTLALLWEEYRGVHRDGYGYSRYCELYTRWEGKLLPVMRQRHPAGERLFVDYTGPTVDIICPKTVSDILQLFSSIWHDTGWGPRMESIFRATLHTLIENPHCSRPSLLTVFNLLLDKEFRHRTKQDISNRQVLDWWDLRFDRGDLHERTRREWVEPVLNKIDTLSLDPLIRNIIGQPRCSLDFEEIIRRRQILIVNLNQNKIGADNAAFIGMLVISRIRQAATKVAAEKEERPNPFAITIDEAHSFPTLELTRIINQGRHSGLYARIAHQHLEQFDPKIASTLRNGCGSLAIFAIGNRDAEHLVDDLGRQSRDQFLETLSLLKTGEAVLRLSRNGAPQPANTTPIRIAHEGQGRGKPESFASFTRERFSTDRLTAEFQIETAHHTLTPEALLSWKSRFNESKYERRKTHRQHTRHKQAHGKARELALASGTDWRNDLKALGDAIFDGGESRVNATTP